MKHERVRVKAIDGDSPRWHYVSLLGDDPRTLCEGWVWWEEDFPDAPVEEFSGIEKITCPECKEIIKNFKSI